MKNHNSRKFRSMLRLSIGMLALVFVFTMNRCKTKPVSSPPKNSASIYNPSSSSFHPVYQLYHTDDSTSRLYVRFPLNDLHFSKWGNQDGEHAIVDVSYRVLSPNGIEVITDSLGVRFQLIKNPENYFVSNIPMRLRSGRQYLLEIIAVDSYRGSSHTTFIPVDKRYTASRQNFLLRFDNLMPLFEEYVPVGTSVRIESEINDFDSVYIDYFSPIGFDTPLPYYISARKLGFPAADSTFIYSAKSDSLLIFNAEGVYRISFKDTSQLGWSISVFSSFYPATRTGDKLVEPLRYLTMPREYRKLYDHPSAKAAIDSFWLASTGNAARAKELIRVYYSRIYFANKFFTDYQEGWMSDRGMIFTIYGPPGTIFKTADMERWIYGGNKNLSSMDFLFVRKENPFSENTYWLIRQEVYKASWYQAVDTWRNGRIYSVQN